MRKKASCPAICVLLLALSFPVAAQQQSKIPKIGWLAVRPAGIGGGYELLRRELRALGYVDSKNIALEYRSAENKIDRLPALADELVGVKVDVLLAAATTEAVAAKKASRTTPIVFFSAADPVAVGLVDSLARPGGNITGFTNSSSVLAGKRLELLREIYSPSLSGCGAVESRRSGCCATMEGEPTRGTRIGSATSLYRGKQRRPIRERVQRGQSGW